MANIDSDQEREHTLVSAAAPADLSDPADPLRYLP